MFLLARPYRLSRIVCLTLSSTRTQTMDSINNTVNTALALKDANVVQEVQATVLKKALNAQADTVATLMQSVAPMAIDSTLGSRINTQA